MRLVFIAALFAFFESQQPSAPAPAQTFRSGAQIVEVDVRVVGKDGRFVTDLGVPDFAITEDGVPQKIQSVVLIDAGGVASAPSVPPVPVPSAPPASHPPQSWVFVFDTNHLTAGPMKRATTATTRFFDDKFPAGDLGGVVVDGKLANNRFTSVRSELAKAARDIKIPGDTRARLLLQREWPRLQDEDEAWRFDQRDAATIATAVQRACTEDPDFCSRPNGRAAVEALLGNKARESVVDVHARTRSTLVTIDALSKGLARMPGPKTVVFFSDGFILQGLEGELRLAVAQAARAGARFYAIDTRGLDRTGGAIIDQVVAFDSSGPSVKFDLLADGPNSLAVDTGGFAIRNENNFGRALDEIQHDAATYYVVGYTPVKEAFDGKYRSISVTVSRPGVKVRARRGYLALEPAALLRPTAAASPKCVVTGGESPAGSSGTKAGSVTPDLPHVPVSPGLLALPETLMVSLPGEAAAAAERSGTPAAAVRTRIDAGKMVMALGRSASAPKASSGGFGETRSAEAERGWAAYEKGDVELAARHLGEAAKAPDARPWVVYALGLSQFALRRFSEAAQAWERVRLEVPEFEPIYFSLADAYGLQHEEGTALKVLREAERRWPADAEVANAIGVIQIRRGALDAAVESFERATTIAPQDGLGYFNLTRAHQMRLLKSQRYDRQMQKWIGGDEDRRRAVANFQKYLALGGPYDRQAQEALASLAWK